MNVVDVFNRMLEASSKVSEMSFLQDTMQSLILPIFENNEFLLVDLLESKSEDIAGSIGETKISRDGSLDLITVTHATNFTGSDQSSAEVYVHELIHVLSKYMFSKNRG